MVFRYISYGRLQRADLNILELNTYMTLNQSRSTFNFFVGDFGLYHAIVRLRLLTHINVAFLFTFFSCSPLNKPQTNTF